MSFSLFRCGDDTYVVVPETLSPPIRAIREFGDAVFLRAVPRNLMLSPAWDRASQDVDAQLFAVVPACDIDEMFALA